MSENKKGVRIREDKDAIHILANDGFSESKKYLDEIFNVLNKRQNKILRIHLSPKGKSFSDAFSKIRRTVMEKEWPDADIRVNGRSQFKQIFRISGDREIHTPSYVAFGQGDIFDISLTSQRTIFANDIYAKELAFLIGLEQPASLNIFMSKSAMERKNPEEFQNRARDLQSFFVRHIRDIYGIKTVSFYEGSQNLLAVHERFSDNGVLFEVERDALAQASEDVPPAVLPVYQTKHVRPEAEEIIEDEKQNKKG